LFADDAIVTFELSENLSGWTGDFSELKYLGSIITNGVQWMTVTPQNEQSRYYGRLKIDQR
jgi:hypothetical protein